MNLVSIISFFICLLIIAVSLKPKTDIFSPGRVVGFVWCLVIGLTDLKLSGFQKQWSLEVWLHVLTGPIAFLIGVLLVNILFMGKKIYRTDFTRKHRADFNLDTSRLFRAVLILFFLFLISYATIYLSSGEIPIFSSKPGEARENFTMFGIGMFLHNVVLIGFFSVLYAIFEKNERQKKAILIFLSIISIVMYAMTLQRFQIFLTIMMIVTLLYYTTFRIKFRTIVLSLVVVIAFFYIISSLRVGEFIFLVLYRISKMKYSPEYAVFTEPYMYVVMNLENYAHSITKIEHFSFGYYTFDFVTAISGLKHWVQEYFHMNETPYLITDNYNTCSALWTFYRDFGFLGIVVIPFVGGISLSSLYYSFKTHPTLQKYALYGMFLFAGVFSFFNSAVSFLWFVFNVFALLVVFKYITRHNNQAKT